MNLEENTNKPIKADADFDKFSEPTNDYETSIGETKPFPDVEKAYEEGDYPNVDSVGNEKPFDRKPDSEDDQQVGETENESESFPEHYRKIDSEDDNDTTDLANQSNPEE